MGEFKLTIGCEIHTELKTKTKMFSPALNAYNTQPNININEIDLALPGTLPQPNKQAVVLGIKLAKLLKMKINEMLMFDRKNYFYHDLPKGYQITQQYFPIGYNGKLKIDNDEYIDIERIHLEEDTAKQIAEQAVIKLDYNRAGLPLLEIVSKPQIHSREQCVKYLKTLKRILVFNNISDGKMENGSLRVDLNVSVSNSKTLGTKVEIKNINSFNNVTKAIDYEFVRQTQLLTQGKKVIQETRRWDDTTQSTIAMRNKANAIDYKYFTEPNIVEIDIKTLVKNTVNDVKLDPEHIQHDLEQAGVNIKIINNLLDNNELYNYFIYVYEKTNDLQGTITWILIELINLINNQPISSIPYSLIDKIIIMMQYIKKNKINGKQAKQIFPEIIKDKKTVDQIISDLGLKQIVDPTPLKNILNKLIKDNAEIVQQYKSRPERVEKFLVGMVMKETRGQANPQLVKTIMDELLASYK